MFKYVILGEPISWKRPGGMRYRYDMQKNEKLLTGIELERQHGDKPLYTGPLDVELSFFVSYPQKISRKAVRVMKDWVITTPDLDNLEKYILDCCSGILYPDDKFVVKKLGIKVYDLNPRTEIIIRELNEKK